MEPVQPVENPFALLLNPADIVAQVERSERLRRLKSRVCRPLDKPLIPCAADGDEDGSGEAAAGVLVDDVVLAGFDARMP